MQDDQNPIGDDPIDPTPAPKKNRTRINRKIHDNSRQTQPKGKSHLKLVEEAKEEAAPAANIVGGKPVKVAGEPPKADPFDVTRYRRSHSFNELSKGAQYLDQIPIGRPAADRWYRAHPGQEYEIEVRLYQPSKGNKKELVAHPYLIPADADPEFVQAILRNTRLYALYYMVDHDGDVFCWQILLANNSRGSGMSHRSPR